MTRMYMHDACICVYTLSKHCQCKNFVMERICQTFMRKLSSFLVYTTSENLMYISFFFVIDRSHKKLQIIEFDIYTQPHAENDVDTNKFKRNKSKLMEHACTGVAIRRKRAATPKQLYCQELAQILKSQQTVTP